MSNLTLHNGDCLQVLKNLPAHSVDLVLTDPPYFNVKDDAWDRQWKNGDDFLAWLDQVVCELERVLKPNGSLYLFASPQMSARVELKIGERMRVLNRITWVKDKGRHNGTCKEAQRAFFPQTEFIVFAEKYGADSMARGEAGYEAKSEELRGFVFEPIREYLDSEWKRAGLTKKQANQATGSFMAGHYFTKVQWVLPTQEKYKQLQEYANRHGVAVLSMPYEDLRKEYEDLRKEYEDLRRYFSVSKEVPCTDVWNFSPVQPYKGKHPCEKPQELLRHIIQASSRPGAVVLDCFMGTGSTGLACQELGRDFIGVELDPGYFETAKGRLKK